MEGFDRKITEEPQYFGDDKKDALIGDFQHYLGTIKAVHEGADLQVRLHQTFSRFLSTPIFAALSRRGNCLLARLYFHNFCTQKKQAEL